MTSADVVLHKFLTISWTTALEKKLRKISLEHDNVLHYIAKCLDHSKYKCYVDIPDDQTPAGGTLPPNVAVTTLKPDIVVIDKYTKSVTIFELTVPAEHRLKIAHDLKYQKYSHFTRNIEIGSHTGYISSDNKGYIHTLHKFCRKSIKQKKFMQNMSAIVTLSMGV